MTLTDAIAGARQLQAELEAGRHADPAKIRAEARRYLVVFEAAATTPEKAREIVEALEGVEPVW